MGLLNCVDSTNIGARFKGIDSISTNNYFRILNIFRENISDLFIKDIDLFIFEIASCSDDLLKPISYLNKLDILNASYDIADDYNNIVDTPISFEAESIFKIIDELSYDSLYAQKYDVERLIIKEDDKAGSIAIKVNLSAPKNLLMKEFEKLIDEVHKSDLYKDRATIKKPFSATYEQELKKLLPLIDMMLFNQHFNYTMTASQYSRFIYPDYAYSDNYIRDFIKRIKTTILTSEYLLWLYQNNVDLEPKIYIRKFLSIYSVS